MEFRNDVAYESYEAEPTPLAAQPAQPLQPFDDLYDYLRQYAREKPEVVALTCFCVGFVLGWKLKPW